MLAFSGRGPVQVDGRAGKMMERATEEGDAGNGISYLRKRRREGL